MNDPRRRHGPQPLDGGRCRFSVWAPRAAKVEVHIVSPGERVEPLAAVDAGYHEAVLDDVGPGALYLYRIDGRAERPDPAARFQPRGPSEVVDATFAWGDRGRFGPPLREYVLPFPEGARAGEVRDGTLHLHPRALLSTAAGEPLARGDRAAGPRLSSSSTRG